jgi:hypothetical protein
MPGAEDASTGVEKQKKRTPAWCDRVLWRPGAKLHQLAYGRAEIAVRQLDSLPRQKHACTLQILQHSGLILLCMLFLVRPGCICH